MAEDYGKAGYNLPKAAMQGWSQAQVDWLNARNKVGLEDRNRAQQGDAIRVNSEIRAQGSFATSQEQAAYNRQGRLFLSEPMINLKSSNFATALQGLKGVGITADKSKAAIAAYTQVLMAAAQGTYQNGGAFYSAYQNNLVTFKNTLPLYTSSPAAQQKMAAIIDKEIATAKQQAAQYGAPRAGNNPQAPASTSRVASSNVLKPPANRPAQAPSRASQPKPKPSVQPQRTQPTAARSQRNKELARGKW